MTIPNHLEVCVTTRTDAPLARIFASYYHFDTRYLNEYGTN
jgi:hypothetical protein